MNAITETKAARSIARPDPLSCIFLVTGRNALFIRAGTTIVLDGERHEFATMDAPVETENLVAGRDYAVRLIEGVARAAPGSRPNIDDAATIGGFHFAPGGNATARAGGDDIPAINPCSCWDIGFRPACPDPRGMALITLPDGARSWIDIYKLGVDHIADGTSCHGVTIADGDDPPRRPEGGNYPGLDYPTAVEVYAAHGKGLLTYDEFRVAALGVTEKSAAKKDPKKTGLDAARTSQCGIMQATGSLWDWGTDGDPDSPRPSLFGGSWVGGDAGSRYARLDYWPGSSFGSLGARGRSDHLQPV